MSFDLSQDNFNYIFTNMEDAVCIMSGKGVLIYANASARKLFGISEESFSDQKIWKYIPYTERNDDLIQMFIDSSKQKLMNHQGMVDYENIDGKIFKLRISMSATKMPNGEILYISIISDLTEFIRVNMAFERYTSREIAQYVLHNPGGELLGGQQKECSILMSDLRGFTALSTKLSPADLIILLNHYFEMMVEVIAKYNGSVIEFLGDGIFVIFGAPKDDSEHALSCVKCAVEMQNAMKAVNEWNEENNYPILEMGIGINSGKVVVGNIGSLKKTKYGCMGENVNLAGRVESYTVGGQIYISQNTKELIAEPLDIVSEDSFMPKGGKQELKIYEIKGVGDLVVDTINDTISWEGVKKEEEVALYALEGKAVCGDRKKGTVKAISADRRYGLLKTDETLLDKQNIMLDIGGDLYAKVIGIVDGMYNICFTSKPDIFKTWLNSVI